MKFDLDHIVGQPEWDFAQASLLAFATAILLVTYVLLLAPLTTVIFERPVRHKVQGYFIGVIHGLVSRVLERAFEFEIVAPEKIDPAENAVVLSNHQCLLDFLILMNFSQKVGLDQSCFFYVWKHCVRLPSWRTLWNQWRKHSDWVVPDQNLNNTFEPLLDSPFRGHGGKWLVIFPEVIPWSASDMLQHRMHCTAMGCQPLNYLLYPRFPAFVQTIGYLRNMPIGAVYDVTVTYSNRRDENRVSVPTLLDVFLSIRDWSVRIEIRRVPIQALPSKEKHLVRWLEKEWYSKDKSFGEFMRAQRNIKAAKNR